MPVGTRRSFAIPAQADNESVEKVPFVKKRNGSEIRIKKSHLSLVLYCFSTATTIAGRFLHEIKYLPKRN
jgi:hypothetical protein